MEGNQLMLKVSRLFPSSLASSCHFRTLPDVAHTSITARHVKGPKCPPNNTATSPAVGFILDQTISSSSSGGWFSTSGDDDAGSDPFFFISSSNRGMKSVAAPARRSVSSTASFDAAVSKCSRKTGTASGESKNRGEKESEVSCNQISTQLYYHARKGDSKKDLGRRKSHRWRMEGSCYAVEKRSRDPRGDFRASMVEMIVENQTPLGADDLERLVLRFLALNSADHHGMILQVFSEICETLFSN